MQDLNLFISTRAKRLLIIFGRWRHEIQTKVNSNVGFHVFRSIYTFSQKN